MTGRLERSSGAQTRAANRKALWAQWRFLRRRLALALQVKPSSPARHAGVAVQDPQSHPRSEN